MGIFLSHIRWPTFWDSTPQESRSHKAVSKAVKNKLNSLKYCYYLYYINIAQDSYDFDEGRQNGQESLWF